jgi:glucose/arabinose dehydrogenase
MHRNGNMMKALIIGFTLVLFSGLFSTSSAQFFIGSTEVDTSTIVTGLDTPWEILWGPDNHIWFTERSGRISRLNPETGVQTLLLIIEEVHEVSESGLMAMVLHPDFVNHPYLYVVYTYLEGSSIKERLVRYTYTSGNLGSPQILIDELPGSSRHDGSRLVIDADLKLFMTTGDATNQLLPQDLSSLNGKVLRLNLDGSIPDDNPISGSYIWSWGHRNAQGLVISPTGIMYSSEHGPSSDDEVNIIEKGRNYGWPTVRGFCDTPTEIEFCTDSNAVEPIAVWTPTLAVAGTEFYHQGSISEWHNSLLVTSLKASQLTALKLSQNGRTVIQEDSFFENWFGRLRDVCISPDGRVFLAVSNRDGRGTVKPGDDRIVEIAALNVDTYCYKEQNVFICPGSTYDFYGIEISVPGTYVDTLVQMGECDSVISVHLYHHAPLDMGLEDTVYLALNESYTLTANTGFISYTWNNDPPSQENSVTIQASEFGEGIHDYTLEVETAHGCIQTHVLKLIIGAATGVLNTEDFQFSVYPNPFGAEGMQIDFSILEEVSLIAYDQVGREVFRTVLNPSETRKRILLPGEAGLYNLVFVTRKGTRSLKVLKY